MSIHADTIKDEDNAILYSEALFYKNLALQSNDLDERNNFFDAAIEKLNASSGSDDSLARVYFQLADIYALKGDLASAEKYAKLSIEKDSSFFPPYNILYTIMMARKEYKGSAALIEKFLAADPDEPYALYLLGVHYYKYLNEQDKSLGYFERVIAASKSREVAVYYLENSYYNIGYINYTNNNFAKSFHYFTKAYELNDSNINAIYMLALSAFGGSDIVNAEKYAESYLSKVPKDLIMEYILGSIYYINDNIKAIEYLSRVKRSQTFEGLVALGLYYEFTDDDSKAENIINSILKYRTDLIAPNIAEARLKYKGGDKSEAYNKLISAGSLCLKNNLLKAADDLFYKALELRDDDNGDVYYFLARSHELNKRYSISISYYKKYYKYSQESNILIHIGYLFAAQKKYQQAYSYFVEASKKDPKNPETYFFWGLANM
jgi:tetratricopeptide (TPR) repeat protein